MKQYISVLTLVLLTFALHAESVWTGNAAVGGPSEFPGSSEVFRAASNSFPEGTVLQVTNPRGGAQVKVTVIGRLESPGVFILIENAAALSIGLPLDHVLPVRVTPLSADMIKEPVELPEDAGKLTEDSDYNPAAMLEEEPGEISTAPVPIVVIEETTDVPETETILTYDLTEIEEIDESVESVVPVTVTADSEEDESRIFFLMPSDLRPPEVDTVISAPTNYTGMELPQFMPGDTRPYVQIGSYRSRTILEDTARNLNRRAPGYPLSIAAETDSGGTIYKLLIGPLLPAETGIVLQTARSSVFPDAFPYSQ